MISYLNKKLHKLNTICEIKEEFLVLWRELSEQTKQNRNLQKSLSNLLNEANKIKNTLIKELENEQKQ